MVRLNGAVAIAEADGPAAALAIVDALELGGYLYWHSTRAELLRRLGRAEEARAAYHDALDLRGHRAGAPLPAQANRGVLSGSRAR